MEARGTQHLPGARVDLKFCNMKFQKLQKQEEEERQEDETSIIILLKSESYTVAK